MHHGWPFAVQYGSETHKKNVGQLLRVILVLKEVGGTSVPVALLGVRVAELVKLE